MEENSHQVPGGGGGGEEEGKEGASLESVLLCKLLNHRQQGGQEVKDMDQPLLLLLW